MGLPAANPDGYVTASVSNVSGFHHADFLLAHGSGDDNVHYANSAHLLDMFTRERVRGYRFRMFTDRCVLPSSHAPSPSPSQGVGRLAAGLTERAQRPRHLHARREPRAVRVHDRVPAREVGQGREAAELVTLRTHV